MEAVNRLGKILFAVIFLAAGYEKAFTSDGYKTAQSGVHRALMRFGLPQYMLSQGLTTSHVQTFITVAIYSAAALELSGASAIIFGGELCGSVMLMIFLLVVTPVYHYPIDANGQMDRNQLSHVLKNLALLGGCLFLFGYAYMAKHDREVEAARRVYAGDRATVARPYIKATKGE